MSAQLPLFDALAFDRARRDSANRPPDLADLDVDRAEAAVAAETADAWRPPRCPGHAGGPQVDRDDDGAERCWKCGRPVDDEGGP